jgi:RNA polymerase sigma-70 factor (ECF subfamily)
MLNLRKRTVDEQQAEPSEISEPTPTQAEQQAAADFLHRLKTGNEDAWTQLTAELSPRLYKYLRGHLPTTEDAEDVLNETFVATVRAITNFDGRVALSTFIYSIANRKVADFWRKRKDVAPLVPEAATTAGPSNAGLEFEEALRALPERSREALLLRYHMGMSVSEVAEIMETSYKATESLLSRARRQLQAVLENTDD